MKTKSVRKHDWPAIVQEWRDSGVTIAKFCRTKGLAISGFYAAKKRYGANKPAMAQKAPKFVEIAPPLSPCKTFHEPTTPTLRITSKDGHVLEVFL